MGISTNAMLLIGLPWAEFIETPEIKKRLEEDDRDDDFDDFDQASPYFDAHRKDRIFGYTVAQGNPELLDLQNLPSLIETARSKFRGQTRAEGRLYLSADRT